MTCAFQQVLAPRPEDPPAVVTNHYTQTFSVEGDRGWANSETGRPCGTVTETTIEQDARASRYSERRWRESTARSATGCAAAAPTNCLRRHVHRRPLRCVDRRGVARVLVVSLKAPAVLEISRHRRYATVSSAERFPLGVSDSFGPRLRLERFSAGFSRIDRRQHESTSCCWKARNAMISRWPRHFSSAFFGHAEGSASMALLREFHAVPGRSRTRR